ncbi:unnamed protein product [Clonostachys rhizophaga]|uniref:D-xylose 1-dehydrogenase (NADP(+), D-xylono-1,5-lactone-forming) n=1 Tax=Clonostachys rhizophaga TaxID=160324 RepID=A0A9N9YL60_9HYPO|nr:unnamed protein product [Clonostachys rhizophaga]
MGYYATGLICSWFVNDLVIERSNPGARHVIQAIASSSIAKGKAFAEKHLPQQNPTIYGSYQDCYEDANVDIIYIGTPHSLHKQNCLDAIAAGKHVLCEKAFTITAKEAREVFDAAHKKGVYVMEATWTRHFPLVKTLRYMIHEENIIGQVRRVFCDYAKFRNIPAASPDSRMRDLKLGAGSLLDVGVYCLTWVRMGLDVGTGDVAQDPKVVAIQTLSEGVDMATSAIFLYPNGQQGIMTTSMEVQGCADFCRIEGSDGFITVNGIGPSVPSSFTAYSSKISGEGWTETQTPGLKSKKFIFEHPGLGFHWEADAVAADVLAGKKENDIMPWAETVKVLEILDEIRRQGGARFPQDDE